MYAGSSIPEEARSELHSSVCRIVSSLQREIDDLLKQKAVLVRRSRKLRRELRTLRAESGVQLIQGEKRDSISVEQFSPEGSGADPTQPLSSVYDELTRACRIALMEAGGTANASQIQSLIAQRGSFSFSRVQEAPLESVIRTLEIMCQAGDICASDGDQTCFYRVVPGTAR